MRTKPSFIMLSLQIYNRVAIGTLTNCSFLFTPLCLPLLYPISLQAHASSPPPFLGSFLILQTPESSLRFSKFRCCLLFSCFVPLLFFWHFSPFCLSWSGRCYFRETVRCACALLPTGGAATTSGWQGLVLREGVFACDLEPVSDYRKRKGEGRVKIPSASSSKLYD